MKFANSLQLSWAVLGFVLGATADSGTVMDIERRADFIDIGIACGGYDVADGKLQDRVDCCETMCATALVNDPLFWSQALVGVGGYCGEYEPAPCDASKSWPITGFDNNACLAGGDGQWKRREKSLVSFGSLCAAKCADAYPLHPFDCEYMDERTDPSVNETVPEFAYYWDCMKNEAAGCENDYELTCNMGEMFDSKCVAKCSVPDGFPSKAVLPSLIGGVQMPYECPAVCELKDSRAASINIDRVVRGAMNLGDELALFQLRVSQLQLQNQMLQEVMKILGKLNDVIGIAEIATKVISKTPIVGPLLVPVNLLLKPAEDATKPAEKLGDKLDNALDNLDDWVFKPLKTIVGATDDALSSLVSTFSITGTIYQDAIECLESSEYICGKKTLQNSMEQFSRDRVLNVADDIAHTLEVTTEHIKDLNKELDQSLVFLDAMMISETHLQMSNVDKKIRSWMPWINNLKKGLTHEEKVCWRNWKWKKKCKSISIQKACDGLDKLMWPLRWLAEKFISGLKKLVPIIPDVDLLDFGLIEKYTGYDLEDNLPHWLQDAGELNELIGLNFQRLNRLQLNFTFADTVDGSCHDASMILKNLGYDVTDPKPEIEAEADKEVDPIIEAVKEEFDLLDVAEVLLDITVSLAVSAKEYAEDGFEAFQSVSSCFNMRFRDAVDCFGLNMDYIEKLIDMAGNSAPATSTSMIAIATIAAVGVGLW